MIVRYIDSSAHYLAHCLSLHLSIYIYTHTQTSAKRWPHDFAGVTRFSRWVHLYVSMYI